MRQPIVIRALAVFLMYPLVVAGQGLEWAAGADVQHYNNIDRLADNGRDDTVATAKAEASWNGTSLRHREDIWASVAYSDYLDDTYSDEFIKGFAGNFTLFAIPEILDWTVEDNYGPIFKDPFGSATPDNRTYTNYFATGPTITIGPGRTTRVVLDGRFSRVVYRDAVEESNNNQYWGDLSLVRNVSPMNEWSIHVGGRSIDYDESGIADYDTYQAYVRFAGEAARTQIQADVGASRLEYLGDSNTEPLWRVNITRTLTPITSLALRYESEYGDTIDQFRRVNDPTGTPDVTEEVNLATLAAPLREQYFGAALLMTGVRTTLDLGIRYGKEDYESDSDLSNQDTREVYLNLLRKISDTLDMDFYASNSRQEFNSADRDDTDNAYGIAVNWRVAGRTFLSLGYRYETRDSSENTADYDTGIISLSAYYSPSGERWDFGF